MDFKAKSKEFLTKLQNLSDQHKKAILWAVVAVLAIVMGLFWIRGAMNSLSKFGEEAGKIKIPQIEIPNTEPFTTVPSTETADWKMYKNNTLNYEFKYPGDFIEQEVGKYQTDDYVFRACYSKNKICLYSNIIRYKQSSFEDYVKLVGQIMTQDNNPNLKGLKSYDIETNSKKGFVLETSVSAPDKESKVIDVFIDYSWPVLVQINISGENIEISELENIYNKLIPTFKFIK